MGSIKVIRINHKERIDGSAPLAIRIISNRKSSYQYIGQYVLSEEWDAVKGIVKKNHPNSTRLNALLSKKIHEANEVVLNAENTGEFLHSNEIKKRITKSQSDIDFFKLGEQRVIQKRKEGVLSVSNAERSILKNLKKFHNNPLLPFQDITLTFLKKFKAYCNYELGHGKRTIANQLIFIRTVYNIAIKDGLVDQKHYPFAGELEKIKLVSGNKIGLTMNEIKCIENMEISAFGTMWHCRNVWLFSFYFAGIRISDVLKLKWTDIVDNRLTYVMNKNNKPLSILVPPRAQKILDSYRSVKKDYSGFIFPFLKDAILDNTKDVFTKTRNGSRLINSYLKKIAVECKIDKNLSNHIARHSFGNIAGDAINPLMLQKLYRHSNLKTTVNYQANFIHKDADEALEKVLNS